MEKQCFSISNKIGPAKYLPYTYSILTEYD